MLSYHIPTIPGVIISHSAISRQFKPSSYHTLSHLDATGLINFPDRLRRNQDVYVSIQPISKRYGLTFTETFILPDNELPSPHGQLVSIAYVRIMLRTYRPLMSSTLSTAWPVKRAMTHRWSRMEHRVTAVMISGPSRIFGRPIVRLTL